MAMMHRSSQLPHAPSFWTPLPAPMLPKRKPKAFITLRCASDVPSGPAIRSFTLEAGEKKPLGRASVDAKRGYLAARDNGFFECSVMSRHHAELEFNEDGRLTICDVKSTHGTTQDGVPLVPHVRTDLKQNSVIVMGKPVAQGGTHHGQTISAKWHIMTAQQPSLSGLQNAVGELNRTEAWLSPTSDREESPSLESLDGEASLDEIDSTSDRENSPFVIEDPVSPQECVSTQLCEPDSVENTALATVDDNEKSAFDSSNDDKVGCQPVCEDMLADAIVESAARRASLYREIITATPAAPTDDRVAADDAPSAERKPTDTEAVPIEPVVDRDPASKMFDAEFGPNPFADGRDTNMWLQPPTVTEVETSLTSKKRKAEDELCVSQELDDVPHVRKRVAVAGPDGKRPVPREVLSTAKRSKLGPSMKKAAWGLACSVAGSVATFGFLCTPLADRLLA